MLLFWELSNECDPPQPPQSPAPAPGLRPGQSPGPAVVTPAQWHKCHPVTNGAKLLTASAHPHRQRQLTPGPQGPGNYWKRSPPPGRRLPTVLDKEYKSLLIDRGDYCGIDYAEDINFVGSQRPHENIIFCFTGEPDVLTPATDGACGAGGGI